MRFSKKLLTALLPIAATGAVVPAVTSCNKGSSYTINFGDEVNCLDEKGTNYHSLNDVKNTIKSRVSIEQLPTISITADWPSWSKSEQNKQMIYFDFIASLSIVKEFKFHLTYTPAAEENKIQLSYKDENGNDKTASGNLISYLPSTEDRTQMNINLGYGDHSISIKSYAFQNTKITYPGDNYVR